MLSLSDILSDYYGTLTRGLEPYLDWPHYQKANVFFYIFADTADCILFGTAYMYMYISEITLI